MTVDEKSTKTKDDLLTKVLREPYEYNTPTSISVSDDTESPTSHYHPVFDEKDYLSKLNSFVISIFLLQPQRELV